MGVNTRRSSYRLRCRCSNPILASNRAAATMTNIDLLASSDGPGAPRCEPCFNLSQIPYDTARRQREAPRKFSALLHAEDGAVGQRHYLFELSPPDRSRVLSLVSANHLAPSHLVRLSWDESECHSAMKGIC